MLDGGVLGVGVSGDLTGMVDGDLTVVLGGGVRGDHAGDGLRQCGRVSA
jgi:hypothetical protein